MKVEIVPATLEHAAAVAAKLRDADREEIAATSARDPRSVLRLAVIASHRAWAGVADGEPVAVFGVAPANLLDGRGSPWLFGTEWIERHPAAFLRRTRRLMPQMRAGYAMLENYVDTRNAMAKRWLAWLGFEIEPAAPYGRAGLPFHRFTMKGY